MNTIGTVEVIDRDGWRKAVPLNKSITLFGSEAGNDVVLEPSRGGGVALRHLQLIAASGRGTGYLLVSLADTDVLLGEGGDQVLAPSSSIEVASGQHVRVGDFKLVFHLESLGTVHQSRAIGLSLRMPEPRLGPGRPLDAVLVVSNLGDESGVQFRLEVEGLEPDHYELGSAPLLFPQAEKEVPLRIHHSQKPTPPAGPHRIVVRAAAPAHYPGESAAVSQTIEVLPFYRHDVRITGGDA
jgi:hypothetical protein